MVWKLIYGGGWNHDRYIVIEGPHFTTKLSNLIPKEIVVVISKERNDTGRAIVEVNRKVGAAILTPSAKSSDTVIGEQHHLVAEYVSRSALNHFVDYGFTVKWETDHYHIDLAYSSDWRKGP